MDCCIRENIKCGMLTTNVTPRLDMSFNHHRILIPTFLYAFQNITTNIYTPLGFSLSVDMISTRLP